MRNAFRNIILKHNGEEFTFSKQKLLQARVRCDSGFASAHAPERSRSQAIDPRILQTSLHLLEGQAGKMRKEAGNGCEDKSSQVMHVPNERLRYLCGSMCKYNA